MSPARDWIAWHEAYGTRDGPLARRLAAVRRRIREVLDASAPGPVRVISLCAGDGRDVLGALADHPRRAEARGRLVELDPELAARARAAAPPDVEVVCGDASTTSAYTRAVPADLVLVCGVFGNVTDTDIHRTVEMLPVLCAPSAHVVWTRHRRPPDRTIAIRHWFAEAGFEEVAFDAPDDLLFGIGLHRYAGPVVPFTPGVRMFTFVGFDALP